MGAFDTSDMTTAKRHSALRGRRVGPGKECEFLDFKCVEFVEELPVGSTENIR
jgi:hypothetical protein